MSLSWLLFLRVMQICFVVNQAEKATLHFYFWPEWKQLIFSWFREFWCALSVLAPWEYYSLSWMPPMLVNTSVRAGRFFFSFPASLYLFAAVGQLLCQFPWSSWHFPEKEGSCKRWMLFFCTPSPIELPCSALFCFACAILYTCTFLYEELPLCSSSDNSLCASAEVPCWKHGKPWLGVAIPHGIHNACSSVVSVLLCCAWCHQPESAWST